jgi:SAM-dependent methyltransferase
MTGMSEIDPDVEARRLATESLAEDDPTGWFERLYAAAKGGAAVVPWDRGAAHPLLVEWIDRATTGGQAVADGNGKRALVVGCGTGWDAELVASLGYETVAFDISETAIDVTRRSHPGSAVHYLAADLLDPPREWRGAFDLVVEVFTVQALPEPLQPAATEQVSAQVAPGGTLLVVAAAREEPVQAVEGPPWPLTRQAVEAFATGDLQLAALEHLANPLAPGNYRWRAEFHRP